MKIRTGELEVIGSGTVQSSGMNDVEFVLSEAPPMIIVARVRKADDGKTAIELSVESSERMVFVFSNPNSINFGPAEAVEVGTLHGRKLLARALLN